MPIKTVLFTDAWRRNELDVPEVYGRKLVDELWDTNQYKSLVPGDTLSPTPTNPAIRWDVVEAIPFDAELVMPDTSEYGSPYVTLHDEKTHTFYPMFYTDFVAMAFNTLIDHGRVSGRFEFVKKNKAFGIRYVSDSR